jgi:hypothetical protein
MPRLRASAPAKPDAAPARTAPAQPARSEPARTAARPAPAARAAAKAEPAAKPLSADIKNKMTADAVRLLKWGKPWHELAELIGRIADRPPVPEIRKFLRANKADIEARAKGG